jgi:hypothetical protein
LRLAACGLRLAAVAVARRGRGAWAWGYYGGTGTGGAGAGAGAWGTRARAPGILPVVCCIISPARTSQGHRPEGALSHDLPPRLFARSASMLASHGIAHHPIDRPASRHRPSSFSKRTVYYVWRRATEAPPRGVRAALGLYVQRVCAACMCSMMT